MLPTRVKDESSKEPAFLVRAKHLWKVAILAVLVGLLVLLRLQNDNVSIRHLQSRMHGYAHNLLKTADMVHARTSAGLEELSEHLDRDALTMVYSQGVLQTVTKLKPEYMHNATGEIEAILAPPPGASQETKDALNAAKVALLSSTQRGVDSLFSCIHGEVGGLVRRLSNEGKSSMQRGKEVQDQLMHSLHNGVGGGGGDGGHEHVGGVPGDLDGDGWVEDLDGDGRADAEYGEADWEAETARWHNETLNGFFEHFDRHMNDPNETVRIAQALEPTDPLYKELALAVDHLQTDQVKWSDVQDLIHSRKGALRDANMPEYVDADTPEDDEFTYAQYWHVQSYLEDCLGPTRLKAVLPKIEELRRMARTGEKSAVSVVAELEDLASDNSIPHYWLHHSADDYYYSHIQDRIDD